MTAYDLRDTFYETINGEKILYPSDTIGENLVTGNLIILFAMHVKNKRLGFIFTHLVTELPDGNIVIPDFMFFDKAQETIIVENPDYKFCGVPDMVTEIFSKSTMKRDVGIKKDIYERNGVKEYWMIDPWRETVDVYLLRGGKYELDGHYENWSTDQLARLTEEERAEVKMEIPVAVLDGFKVKIRNIFGWYFE